MIIVQIEGKAYKALTRNELAEFCGRSAESFKSYEKRGILPAANFRTPNSDVQPGKRLYTLELAQKLKSVFEGVSQGTKITSEQRRQIALAFQEEQNQLFK